LASRLKRVAQTVGTAEAGVVIVTSDSYDLGLIYMNARYYLPEVGRFISPDTLVPDPGNPQSHNRYSYVLNSPVNYTDPSGHREIGADENDLLPNQPPPTISEQLSQGYNVYGIIFTADQGEAWTNQQIAAVLRGVAAVDRQLRLAGGWSGYMPGAAFQRVYGSVTCHRSSKDRDYGGETFGRTIEFYDKAFTVALSPQFRNSVVHEMGHAFNAAIVRATNGHINPYKALKSAVTESGPLGIYGVREGMPPYPWQQATINKDTENEVFADWFLSWTYQSFLTNDAGRAQEVWMDQGMGVWLGR
jgi:RHS repeat-associated protein